MSHTVAARCTHVQVTEESLANFFADCGTVMDCRICGDPNSAMRFAFIEFAEDVAAQKVPSLPVGGGSIELQLVLAWQPWLRAGTAGVGRDAVVASARAALSAGTNTTCLP